MFENEIWGFLAIFFGCRISYRQADINVGCGSQSIELNETSRRDILWPVFIQYRVW